MIIQQEEIILKIKALREKYQSPDSTGLFDVTENELDVLFKDKANIENNPIFLKFCGILEKRINELNALLMNDESLLNESGKVVAAQRKAFQGIASIFSIKIIDNSIESIKKLIEQHD